MASKNPLAAPALGDIHPSAISEIHSLKKSQMLHRVRSQQPLVKTSRCPSSVLSQCTVHNILSFPPLPAPRVAQLWKGNTADMQNTVKALMEYWNGPQM